MYIGIIENFQIQSAGDVAVLNGICEAAKANKAAICLTGNWLKVKQDSAIYKMLNALHDVSVYEYATDTPEDARVAIGSKSIDAFTPVTLNKGILTVTRHGFELAHESQESGLTLLPNPSRKAAVTWVKIGKRGRQKEVKTTLRETALELTASPKQEAASLPVMEESVFVERLKASLANSRNVIDGISEQEQFYLLVQETAKEKEFTQSDAEYLLSLV